MGKADGETNPQFSSEARKDQKVLYKFQKVSLALSDVPIETGPSPTHYDRALLLNH